MTLLPRTVVVPALVLLAWLTLLLALPGRVNAQGSGSGPTVYRCGAGQYSSEPCPGGVKLDTPAPPTPEQQRLAREAAARDARMAQQLADERRARERAAAAQAVSVGPTTASKKAVASAEPKATKQKKDRKDRKGQKADAQAKPSKAGKADKAQKSAKARKAKATH